MPLYSEYVREKKVENFARMDTHNRAPQPIKNEPVTYVYKARRDDDAPPSEPIPSKPAASPTYQTYPDFYPTHLPHPLYCYPQQPYAYPVYQYNPPHYYYPTCAAGPSPAPVSAPVSVCPTPATGPVYYTYPGYNPYYQLSPAVPPAAPAPTTEKIKYPWYGRTRSEVQQDNALTAAYTGGLNTHSWEPVGVAPETQYHVLEKDGVTQNTYPYATIKGSFEGYWSQHNGVTYFVRKKD